MVLLMAYKYHERKNLKKNYFEICFTYCNHKRNVAYVLYCRLEICKIIKKIHPDIHDDHILLFQNAKRIRKPSPFLPRNYLTQIFLRNLPSSYLH